MAEDGSTVEAEATLSVHAVIVLLSNVTAPFCAKRITADYFSAGIKGDARQCENVPCERCACAKRRGTANPEKYIATLSTVDQQNARTAGSGQRASDVDDEDRVLVALPIK